MGRQDPGSPVELLLEILQGHKAGSGKGIASICSSHPFVLETAVEFAANHQSPLLIESTCNQVNQDGGYTGMSPAQFSSFVTRISDSYGLGNASLILGGDHLGPYPWANQPAKFAMDKACRMIEAYVHAGYRKIHLDASMHCQDDDLRNSLSKDLVAERSAVLCVAAENAARQATSVESDLLYVIGSEVPPPGGTDHSALKFPVTSVQDLQESLQSIQQAFTQHGLQKAWERVIAMVVQPGVEFGTEGIQEYNRAEAKRLSQFVEKEHPYIYEAHSTDYQSATALREMVEDHFAILKVGPELTYAYREAIFALELIESELIGTRLGAKPSRLSETIERVMLENPAYWEAFYTGSEEAQAQARRFSYSDRIRYYWSHPEVQSALADLFKNLETNDIPLNLLSQFMPRPTHKIRDGRLPNSIRALIADRICTVLEKYAHATGSIESINERRDHPS